MKMMIQETRHSTLRVYVSNPTEIVTAIMDCVSIWGGSDKDGSNYKSWEISTNSTAAAFRCAGKHVIGIEDFELIETIR